ncbi:ATPase [Streptomyces camponoticapitis]|uniref:histidine kinase n=1 Tax=Streptomyces camponoticapitis TaxID=1616125 RepID=A0ABQ2EHU5_9ACTN|nr:sensor histidine kinase [Streptomyces camponoticapitis]GGK11863.1 ATPase [Streptomyces camponoticapitis]
MPELSPHAAPADRRSGRRRGRSARNTGNTGNAAQAPAKANRNLATEKGLRSRIRLLVVTPVATVSVLAAGSWSTWYFVGNTVATWSAVGAAAVIGVGSMVAATRKAAAVSTAVHEQRVTNATSARQWVERFEAVTAEGQKNIAQLLEQITRGERPLLPEPMPHVVSQGNPFADLEQALRLAQHQALAAVAEAGARQQVDVFVNIAQRLHALVNRALARLDDLESEVEDPDLLGGLFGVDHLVTQFRRQVESLAVMGGAVPRRINKPVPLPTVLRQGVAEIEQYARVRVIQPPEGTLPGYAAAEVIHLLAELVENAARFSAPETQVTLRAERVPAGLAIEIDDRGLPMAPEKLERMNRLLTRPDQFDIREQLEDGRIGLFVVAQIARRHDIEVALRRNIYGGTQAVVVLPSALLDAAPPPPVQRQPEQEQHRPGTAEHAQRMEPSHEPSSGAAWSHPQSPAQPTSPQTPAHTPQQAPHDSPYQAPQPSYASNDHRSPLPAEAGARSSRGGRGTHGETPSSVRRIGSPSAHAAAAAAATATAPGGPGSTGEVPLPQRKPAAYSASNGQSNGVHGGAHTPGSLGGAHAESPYGTGNHQGSGHTGGGRPTATAHPNSGQSSAGRSTTGSADVTPPEVPRSTQASPPSDASTPPGRRPTLPRRSETYRGPEFPRLADADREVVAPNPDLMARFASGIRLASSEDGPQGPPDQTS